MRIVDKRKDYYDGLQGMDGDRELLYVRHEEKVDRPFSCLTPPGFSRYYLSPMSSRFFVVGFCGVIYPVIEFFPPSTFYPGKMVSDHVRHMCHTLADVDAHMQKHLDEKALAEYRGEGEKKRRYGLWGRKSDHNGYEDFYKKFDEGKLAYASYFDEKHSPVFVVNWERDKTEIVYNPLLRPYEFARVKDPYTAYQDIRMWLSNHAMPNRPIPKLSDEDLAHSKGHGDKYSFRKPPSR